MKINWSEPGVPLSAVIHAALLLATLIAFTTAPNFEEQPESIAVDMITTDELTALTKGDKTAKAVKPDAKIKVDKQADQPAPKPDSGEAKKDIPTPAAKPPEPQQEQKPEPPKPEAPTPPPPPQPAKPEVKPQPAPEEPKPDGLKQAPPPKPEPPKPQPPKFEADQLAKLLDQQKKAQPPKPAEAAKKTEPNFDPNALEKLLQSKETPQKMASTGTELSKTSTAGSATGTASKLTLSQRDQLSGLLRDQITKCWSPPAWVTGADNLRPIIRIGLREDGSLDGLPAAVDSSSDPSMKAMEESAIRAIRQCAPFNIPPQFKSYYSDWKSLAVTFDMKAML
ncbi:MAG: hypothetical protein RLZZ496_8 [Pseudomonadota bacterium]